MLPVVEAEAIVLADDESVVAVDVSVAPLTFEEVEPAVPATLPVADVEVSSFFSVELISLLVDVLLSVAATVPLVLALPLSEPEVDDGVSVALVLLCCVVSLLATFEESVLVASVELVDDEDGVVDVSLEASEPEALPEVDALPLNDPEAELGELVSLDMLELLVAGSLLATREESVLVEEVSLDVEELGLVLLLESVLATLESVAVRPVGERSSLEEADVAPELIEPLPDKDELDVLFCASEESVLAVLEERSKSDEELIAPLALAGCDDVVSMLPDADDVPFKPNEPEVLVFAADVSVVVLLAAEVLAVELLTVAFWLW